MNYACCSKSVPYSWKALFTSSMKKVESCCEYFLPMLFTRTWTLLSYSYWFYSYSWFIFYSYKLIIICSNNILISNCYIKSSIFFSLIPILLIIFSNPFFYKSRSSIFHRFCIFFIPQPPFINIIRKWSFILSDYLHDMRTWHPSFISILTLTFPTLSSQTII